MIRLDGLSAWDKEEEEEGGEGEKVDRAEVARPQTSLIDPGLSKTSVGIGG